MKHTFEARQWVPHPASKVFLFFANPENLPPLMPAWQRARIDHSFLAAPPPSPSHPNRTTPIAGSGSVLTITFRPLPFVPLRLRWIAVIEDFAWDHHFCDTQKGGPFAFWKHCHHISPESRDGIDGTLVADHVTYALPLGPLGDLANMLGARRQLASTFRYRQKQLRRFLEAQPEP